MCPAGEISLRHVQFLDSIGACNGNAIVAQGVSVQSNLYTSRLNVTLTSELVGRTVTCSLDDGISVSVIGTTNLTQTTTSEFHVTISTMHAKLKFKCRLLSTTHRDLY